MARKERLIVGNIEARDWFFNGLEVIDSVMRKDRDELLVKFNAWESVGMQDVGMVGYFDGQSKALSEMPLCDSVKEISKTIPLDGFNPETVKVLYRDQQTGEYFPWIEHTLFMSPDDKVVCLSPGQFMLTGDEWYGSSDIESENGFSSVFVGESFNKGDRLRRLKDMMGDSVIIDGKGEIGVLSSSRSQIEERLGLRFDRI